MRVTLMLRPSPIICSDGRHALGGGRDLDQQVGPVDPLVQRAGGGDRAGGVVGQGRGHLERDEAVGAPARVVARAAARPGRRSMSVDHQLPVGVLHGMGRHQRAELLVVVVLALDGLGEDGRVGGHPADARRSTSSASRPPVQPVAPQVVEPGALAPAARRDRAVGSSVLLLMRGVGWARSVGIGSTQGAAARSATFSAVKPNSASATSPGAEAPKVSMATESSA